MLIVLARLVKASFEYNIGFLLCIGLHVDIIVKVGESFNLTAHIGPIAGPQLTPVE